MNLKTKLFGVISLTWLVFLGLSYFISKFFIHNFTPTKAGGDFIFFIFTGIAVLYLITTILVIYLVFFKRLKIFEYNINKIKNKNHIEHINISGHDELTAIANKVNRLIDDIDNTHDKLKQSNEENVRLRHAITEQKLVERELLLHKEHLIRLAHYDKLTSLPNRIFFNEILNKTINHSKEYNKQFAILVINMDHFKVINDTFGHHAGNMVLKEISNRLKNFIRTDDVIARLDGDEFVILLNGIEHHKFVATIASQILEVCSQPIKIETHTIVVTASIAICIYPNDGQSLELLQKNADLVMNRIKHSGGNTYEFYQSDMGIATKNYIMLDTSLKKSIEQNELSLYFQPQLNLITGKIKTVEALLRWKHPELGLIKPDKFIPIAEESDLIMHIGEWVINEACRISKAWQDQGYDPISIAINISFKQLREQNISAIVSDALTKNNLQAKYLIIEITETSVMENLDIAINKLKQLNEIGIRISIDDFGTGYTSINYLKQFPVNILKIDRAFIKGIPHNPNDMAITKSIISLGHNLGLEVIAEGVETTDQIQYLAEQHCDAIQGYFLSRPLPENKIILQFSKKKKTKAAVEK